MQDAKYDLDAKLCENLSYTHLESISLLGELSRDNFLRDGSEILSGDVYSCI